MAVQLLLDPGPRASAVGATVPHRATVVGPIVLLLREAGPHTLQSTGLLSTE